MMGGKPKAGVRQYKWLCCAGLLMMLVDISVNSTFLVYSQSKLLSLLLYIIQDVCLVFSVIILAVATFSTSLLKIGLFGEAVCRLKWSILGLLLYLGLSVSFHTLSLHQQWDSPAEYVWSDPMLAFFSIQRIGAAAYYYLFKRALFRLSDEINYE